MPRRLLIGVTASLPVVLLLSLAGCGGSSTPSSTSPAGPGATAGTGEHAHDHDHAQPEDFAAGVAALEKHHADIKAAFAAGDAESAHDPLHSVGGVLESLAELARAAGLSADDLDKLDQSVEQMFAAYGGIDDAIHTGGDPDYEAVSAQLDEALAAIEALQPPQ